MDSGGHVGSGSKAIPAPAGTKVALRFDCVGTKGYDFKVILRSGGGGGGSTCQKQGTYNWNSEKSADGEYQLNVDVDAASDLRWSLSIDEPDA